MTWDEVFCLLCRDLEMQQWEKHPLFKWSVFKDIYRLKEAQEK